MTTRTSGARATCNFFAHGAACPLGGFTTFSTSVEGDFMATQKHIRDIGERNVEIRLQESVLL